MANIVESYDTLKHLKDRNEGEENGYLASAGYPKNFQTVDFPKLAGQGGAVTTLAHYQAFFFVARKDPAKKNDAENQKLDASKLKELFANIYDNDTRFTMKMDADALRMDSDAFAKKLGDAGDDAPQVKAQIDIIKDFINKGGIRAMATEVIREKNPGAEDAKIALLTDGFLKKNFTLQGVETAQPLTSAVWQVEAKKPDGTENGRLEGIQNYYKDKKWDGAWQIGSQPELEKLAGNGHAGAKEIMGAVKAMSEMKTIDMTHGIKQDTRQSSVSVPDHLLDALDNIGKSASVAGVNIADGAAGFAGTKKPLATGRC